MTVQRQDFPLQLPVFKIINDSRSTYGLRHQDFNRYKNHCTNKVAHLRKSVGLTQVANKTKKYAKKEVNSDNLKSDKHLQILLFDAERAWAHSQAIKSTLSNPATPPSKKHDVTRRLSRAALASSKLASLSSALSPSQQGQVKAYNLVLLGTLKFEQSKYQEGLEVLSLANALLGVLANEAKEAKDEALVNEMIDEVEPMLRFCAYSLEYDTSQGVTSISTSVVSSLDKDKLVPDYDNLIKEIGKEGSTTSSGAEKERVEISFRGKEIPVRNAGLVSAILRSQKAIEALEVAASTEAKGKGKGKAKSGKKEVMGVKKMNAFDKSLLVLGEAQEMASQLVEDNKMALNTTNSSRYESSSLPLSHITSYLSYHLLTTRIARDLLLISSSVSSLSTRLSKIASAEESYIQENGMRDPKIREEKERRAEAKTLPGLVRLLDGVVMGLEALREVGLVEDDVELSQEVESRIALARGKRCLYLSKAHALLSNFSSSLSLSTRAKLYIREARSISSSLSSPFPTDENKDLISTIIVGQLPLDEKAFDELERELEKDGKKIGNEWYSSSGGKFTAEEEEVEMMEQLDLSSSKGKASKGEKKEAFYDVAFNYVTAFDLDAIRKKAGMSDEFEDAEHGDDDDEEEEEGEEEEEAEVKAEEKKKGWGFGLFGRK